jgi:hypothetical protein
MRKRPTIVCECTIPYSRRRIDKDSPIYTSLSIQKIKCVYIFFLSAHFNSHHAFSICLSGAADQHGEYDLTSSPVFVYMPHCDIGLHERLLRRNFDLERLSNLLMIANDLSVYVERSVFYF